MAWPLDAGPATTLAPRSNRSPPPEFTSRSAAAKHLRPSAASPPPLHAPRPGAPGANHLRRWLRRNHLRLSVQLKGRQQQRLQRPAEGCDPARRSTHLVTQLGGRLTTYTNPKNVTSGHHVAFVPGPPGSPGLPPTVRRHIRGRPQPSKTKVGLFSGGFRGRLVQTLNLTSPHDLDGKNDLHIGGLKYHQESKLVYNCIVGSKNKNSDQQSHVGVPIGG